MENELELPISLSTVCFEDDFKGFHVVLKGLSQDHKESLTLPCTGLTTWDAGILLARFMVSNPTLFCGKRLIELGCGLGLCAIIGAHLNATHFTFTDGDSEAVEAATQNLSENMATAPQESKSCVCEGSVLRWGEGTHLDEFVTSRASQGLFDVVLAADVIYQEFQVTSIHFFSPCFDFFVTYTKVELIFTTIARFLHFKSKAAVCFLGFCRRGVSLSLIWEAAEKRGLSIQPVYGWTRDIFGEDCVWDSDLWSASILQISVL
jgi:predicted nicotinamide N-methyase